MKIVFVDTGAWNTVTDANTPDHPEVLPFFREYLGRLVTSNYVFDETLTLLHYRLEWKVAHTFGEQVLSGKIANLIWVTEQATWEIFSRYQDKSFSFTGCSSFVLTKRLNIAMALALEVDSDFRAYGLHCVPYLQE